MSLSRWKMVAGVLGVSLGGLAAASQCPKTDAGKTARHAPEQPTNLGSPVLPALPAVPPAGSGSAPKLPAAPPAPSIGLPLPTPPVELLAIPAVGLPQPPAVKLPDLTPPQVSIPPMMPVIPAGGTSTKAEFPPLPVGVPDKPPATPVLPSPKVELPSSPPKVDLPSTLPAPPKVDSPVAQPKFDFAPPAKVDPPLPTGVPEKPPATPLTLPVVGPIGSPPDLIPPTKVTPPSGGTVLPPPVGGVGLDPLIEVPPVAAAKPPVATVPNPVVPANAAVVNKFRILLRVGEGEPTFEVKCGDDLVLKVTCEKVDIKSPEKGSGLSAVKASGKVRFVGFGAEGTCDELSFLAGTGEVSMTGDVKVQVKDKLGRVESELSSATLKYKIDPCVVVAKP